MIDNQCLAFRWSNHRVRGRGYLMVLYNGGDLRGMLLLSTRASWGCQLAFVIPVRGMSE